MKGFQLLGVTNSLMRWGKVLKKLITDFVSPYSELISKSTYPTKDFVDVWMFAHM